MTEAAGAAPDGRRGHQRGAVHPHRAAWSRERALEHILNEAGTHFDPEVVRAFVALLNSTP